MPLAIGLTGGSGGGGSATKATTSKLLSTGQTTSYRTGDDGDLEDGRLASWLVLSQNNPYGNTTRFLDIAGGSSFSDDIVIDWSVNDEENQVVLGWDRVFRNNVNWDEAIDGALATSIGAFTSGWKLPNFNEALSIHDTSLTNYATYAPFSFAVSFRRWWTSTTYASTTTQARIIAQAGVTFSQSAKTTKTTSDFYLACRYFTYAELGL